MCDLKSCIAKGLHKPLFPPFVRSNPSPPSTIASSAIEAAIVGLYDRQCYAYLDADNLKINNKGGLAQMPVNCNNCSTPYPNNMSDVWSNFKHLRAKVQIPTTYDSV